MKRKPHKVLLRTSLSILFLLVLITPLTTNAAIYRNPLPFWNFDTIILRTIYFLLSLTGLIALLGIVYGGLSIIIGGMRGEQDIKRGKEILFWSIMGLIIIGMAATILSFIKGILVPY